MISEVGMLHRDDVIQFRSVIDPLPAQLGGRFNTARLASPAVPLEDGYRRDVRINWGILQDRTSN